MKEPRVDKPRRIRASRWAARAAAVSCAVTAVLAIALPGLAHARDELNDNETWVIGMLAYAYNKKAEKGELTTETNRNYDNTLRRAADDWDESYVVIRELFDSYTGGVGEFRGNFETANITDGSATRVTGWACLPKHPFSHVNIDVYENGTSPGRHLGTVVANLPRDAAVADQCGGVPEHGFDGVVGGVCTTPGAVIPLRIDAYAVDPDFPDVRQPFPSKSGAVLCP